ncbi:methylated-DNA--protein-cysteine methyltransferase, constitutive [Geobacter sp. OR-1]|uniref:methylated-DNA--[protein]-cysteine S-methyltransferase n=1 Tax=Geobacter sp. OR-1 TaxID=1266765 RepID=UPI000541FBDB|nr:methylated-DNA--[protein]-cysteine S-methyltransferase [Geobacter sp. OR-1]GAM11852.1 methylated-DNA--protein-cysteine methyltransferase, constitutive [Geobacter sp. OR-1]
MKCTINGCCYSLYSSSPGWGGVVAGNDGLVEVFLPFGGNGREEMIARIISNWPDIREGGGIAAAAAGLLAAYFEGEKVTFGLPIDMSGFTAFQHDVYMEVAKIPYGSTMSYAAVAVSIGRPLAARGVGASMAANRLPVIIPCHRVVAKSGGLTGYSAPGGLASKSWLLRLEGVGICDNKRVCPPLSP